jgi:cysteine dioxygenase
MKTIEELSNTINNNFNNGILLKNMMETLSEYDGVDWCDHINFNKEKYVKNTVYQNDLFDILIICWNLNQSSDIHDHPENGCLVKILEGSIVEECYTESINIISTNKLTKNDISYQEGKSGLHKIINPCSRIRAISMHIYSPPNYTPIFYKI